MYRPTTSTEQMLATVSKGVSLAASLADNKAGLSIGGLFFFIESPCLLNQPALAH